MFKRQFIFIYVLILFFSYSLPVFGQSPTPTPVEERQEAVVSRVLEEREISDSGVKRKYQKLELRGVGGKLDDQKIIVEHGKVPIINSIEYNPGDEVVLSITKDDKGSPSYFITDYVRKTPLLWLFALFIFLTIVIGGKRGIFSVLGMAISFVVIFFFVLPQILKGQDPILIAILSSIIIIPVTFYLSHGYNKKTTVAVIGTISALIITGFLAKYFVDATYLTGLASEEATFLESAKQGTVELKGLLLAGIIIGALGVLDDITISQAAIVFQLKSASPRIGIKELFLRAMDIGQDHIASMVNTLVLIYTGAALPLLLLFINNSLPFSAVINFEMISEEIVRTLVVSIGLILSVPLVTLLAAITSDIEVKQAAKDILSSLK
jgi:uncharacterized membrane protein